jgi:hypothetical protein
LTDEEFHRLGQVLNEIQTLRWKDVDLEAAELRLRDTNTGARMVSLSRAAVTVLSAPPRPDDNPWVTAGENVVALAADEQVVPGPALHDVVAAPAVDRVMARAADQDVGLIRRFTEVGHRCLLLAHPSICIGGRVGRRRLAIPFY